MSEARRLSSQMIQASQLVSIRLQRLVAESKIRAADQIRKPSLRVGYGAKVGERSKTDVFVIVTAEALVRDEALEASESAVRIVADLELQYAHPADLEVSEQELSAFAELNAVFNAWPYLREVLQSTSVRMGLPPVILPLFRIPSGVPGIRSKRRKAASAGRSRANQTKKAG